MWYDIDKSCSYNQLFNFIVGPRGYGKTYAWKKKAIRDFIRKGKQFVYLRRYDTELKQIQKSLFNDIIFNNEFPGYDIEISPDGWRVNNMIAGYPMALTQAHHYKSSSFPEVYNICFDEFIIEKGKISYLKNEPTVFLDFYETIARKREDVIAFFMANAITLANPYFLKWGLTLPKDKKYIIKNNMLLEYVEADEEYKESKEATRFGQIARIDGYASYSVDNKFKLDDDSFIAQKGKDSHFLFMFAYHEKTYGVWVNDWTIGELVISYDYDKCSNRLFNLNKETMIESVEYVKQLSTNMYVKHLYQALLRGRLYYESAKIKMELRDMLAQMI